MRARPAFTLLELIVSIAVAGIIALLVYGSASAGFDTRDRLARHRATSEAELRGRALLTDALRHASDEADAGLAAFALTDAVDQRGVPADELRFLTRGILPPLGASTLWMVRVTSVEAGVRIDAAPVGPAPATPLSATLPGIHGFDVSVLALAVPDWRSTWQSPAQLPAAVQFAFYDRRGAPVGALITVRLGLEAIQ